MALNTNLLKELMRYGLASAAALAADVGLLYALTSWAHVPYLISALAGFMAGLAIVYTLSVTWVFKKRALEDRRAELLIFAVIGVVGLGINELVLWALTDGLGLYYLLSKAVSVGAVFTWNFGARKYMLFGHE